MPVISSVSESVYILPLALLVQGVNTGLIGRYDECNIVISCFMMEPVFLQCVVSQNPLRFVHLYIPMHIYMYMYIIHVSYLVYSQVVSPAQYQAHLESLGILIKAKNFLVFQVFTHVF